MFSHVSYRRRMIDRDLFRYRHLLKGRVLDLGGGRTRGAFPHGKLLSWIVLDEDIRLKPSVVGDGQMLPFLNNSFDAVKSSELTGYLFEPLKMIQEIARILKPGGHAVITSPFLTPFDREQHDGIRLTSAWWDWAAKKTGMRIEKIEAQGYLFTIFIDAKRYWISHWWYPFRYLAYFFVYPLYDLVFWIEQHGGVPKYLKRFSGGFLIVLKKSEKKKDTQ